MSKSYYSAAIFFTVVYLFVNFVLFIILSFQLGDRVLFMNQLSNVVFLQVLILLGWSIIFLIYYRHKQYWFAFWIVIFSIGAYIFEFILYRYFLLSLEISLLQYMSYFLVQGLGILYGTSLIFSAAGRRLWLRLAGIVMIFSGIALIGSNIWKLHSIDYKMNGTAEEFEMWIFLVSNLSLLFFLLNFYNEKAYAVEIKTPRQNTLVGSMIAGGFMAFFCTLFIGIRTIHEGKWILDHPNHVSEYLEKMVEPFEAKIYVSSQGDSLRYRLLKPHDYDSTKLYPIVISLHGSGARGIDNAKQVAGSYFPLLLSKEANREKYAAFLFVPQCPFHSWWGDRSGNVKMDDLLMESLLDLENQFAIDENRRYLTGISMGGYGVWHLISLYPELYAAAIPIAGAGIPGNISNRVDVPVWAFHGEIDGNVPVNGSREMIEALKKTGGIPLYTEFPNTGHNLQEQLDATPGILDWLFSQKRNSNNQ